MQHTSTLKRSSLLTLLLFVFLGFSTKILAQKKFYPVTTVDTFTLYQKMQFIDSLNLFSPNTLEINGTYGYLVNYGTNPDLFLYRYGEQLELIDSTEIQVSNNQTVQNTYITTATGFILMNHQGVYQYTHSNTLLWNIEATVDEFFESIQQTATGYILCGGIVRNDSLYSTLCFIKNDGSIGWKKEFYLLQNSYISITEAVTYYDGYIYFMYADSNQIRSILNGADLIPSSMIIKVTLDGTISSQTSVAISSRKFITNKTDLFLFGDEIDATTNQSAYRLYVVDTATSTPIVFFKNPWKNMLPYENKWLSITNKNTRSDDRLQSRLVTTIDIFTVLDTTTISNWYHQTSTTVLPDTFTYGAIPNKNIEFDNKGAILMTIELSQKFIQKSNGFLLYKFLLRKDTLPTVDSLWALVNTVNGKEVNISWKTVLSRNSVVIVWNKNTPTVTTMYSDSTNKFNHFIKFSVSPGIYFYYVQSQGGVYQDTLMGMLDSFMILDTSNGTGITSEQIDTLITIFPNPSSGTVILQSKITGTIVIYKIEGTPVLNQQITDIQTKIILDQLPVGIYVYRMCTKNNNIITGKIIIQ